jgi:hypothetical protein
MAWNSLSLSSPYITTLESSLAYSPPIMAAKHLNLPPVPSLAGNVGNMSATRRRRFKKLPNLGRHATFCQHKKYPDTRILRRKSPTNCRYRSTYRYCSTYPQGWKNTVDKLNKSKLSRHVNVLTLVLPLVRWWCCCCCLFLWQWTTVSLITVVAVAAVAARRQQQRWQGQQWTMIGGNSGRQ